MSDESLDYNVKQDGDFIDAEFTLISGTALDFEVFDYAWTSGFQGIYTKEVDAKVNPAGFNVRLAIGWLNVNDDHCGGGLSINVGGKAFTLDVQHTFTLASARIHISDGVDTWTSDYIGFGIDRRRVIEFAFQADGSIIVYRGDVNWDPVTERLATWEGAKTIFTWGDTTIAPPAGTWSG